MNLYRKGIVIAMVGLFIGASIFPSIMGEDPLPPPVLKGPGSSEGEYIDTLTPTFEWEDVPGATEYGLYISRYADVYQEYIMVFNSQALSISITGTSYKLPAGILKPGIRYRWNMNSFDGTKWGFTNSDRFYFTTKIANGGVRGIDVSKWQDKINWDTVCNWQDSEGKHIEFAYIRATYGIDNKLTTIEANTEGMILYHDDNDISANGYEWWHVRFGDKVGWMAEDGIEKVDNPMDKDFVPDDQIKTITEFNLRTIPGIIDNGEIDPKLTSNMNGIEAHNAGLGEGKRLLTGVYHFARPGLNDAVSEARHFVAVAGDYLKPGFLRPMLDLEEEGFDSKWVHQFISTVKAMTSAEPIIYILPSWANKYLDDSVDIYDLWTPRPLKYPIYTCPVDYFPEPCAYTSLRWDSWVFWQYGVTKRDSENLPGINVDGATNSYAVDLDVFNGDRSALEEFAITSPGDPQLDILSPTTSNPSFVSNPDNPVEFFMKVDSGLEGVGICYIPQLFDINIGNKPADFQLYHIDLENNYYFKVTSPTQSSDGSYDLEIILNTFEGEILDSDIESNAVIYSSGGNVDVMTVIDKSGSMSGNKIAVAKTASSLFVDLMQTNDMIGVASFGYSGYLNFPLTEITSETIKQQVKNAINALYASGWTAMGSGLQQGYNQLANYGNQAHPWSIILLSDGYHNTGIHPYTVLPSIQNENIKVFTIGLGTSVDQNLLQYIADNTGGEYYYSPGTEELTTIYQAIAGVVKAESTVKTEEGSINVGDTVTETVNIDSSIDTATFTLNWESGTCDLELKRPDGTVVLPSDSDVLSHAVDDNYETFTITDPADGTWVMEITRTHASSLKYTVTVTASTDVTFHLFTDKDDYHQEEPVHLISTLSNSGNPITGADVDVTIEKPDGSFDYTTLFDDGYHDDGMASDGVYANYYTNTDLGGSYIINAYASGTIGTEEFTRETAKTVQVSGIPSEGLSVTPASWDTEAVYTGEHIVGEFTIDSLSLSDESVSLTATDLINDTDIISAENILFAPETFGVPASDSTSFYIIIFTPEDAKPGNYTGNIILTSTVNSITIPVKLWIVESIHPSTIDIDPDTLNLNSSGKWITCYIELPDGYDVEDINISTIMLNDNIPAEDHPTNISDYDNDGIPDLIVKFDRQAVQDILEPNDSVEIKITGGLTDGTKFEGIDYIRVI